MNAAIAKALLRELRDIKRQSVRRRIGEVTATSPLSVALGGSTVPYTDVKRLASYSPTIGDVVAVDVSGNDLLVLGEIA